MANLFPDSLFQAVKETLMAEYKPGTTVTSPHGAENRAIKATEQVLATLARHYEAEVDNADD